MRSTKNALYGTTDFLAILFQSTPHGINARFLTSFELNNEWYIGMGVKWDSLNPSTGDPYPSNKFWKYNPANNVWRRLADFPGSYQRNPTCFSIGAKAYAFYGAIPIGDPNIATTFNQEFWEYDPASNSWRQLNLPNSLRPLPGEKYQIFTHNGKAYFLTAQKRELFLYYYGYQMQNHCLEFDPATGTFKRIAHMLSPNLLRLIGNIDNSYFFYSDTFGYYEALPNKTYQFTVE